jgi:hypothetical protein
MHSFIQHENQKRHRNMPALISDVENAKTVRSRFLQTARD